MPDGDRYDGVREIRLTNLSRLLLNKDAPRFTTLMPSKTGYIRSLTQVEFANLAELTTHNMSFNPCRRVGGGVTEFATGGELFDRLVHKGAYSEHDAASFLREVADALAYLHGNSIVHFDLKPENILVRKGGEIMAYSSIHKYFICTCGCQRYLDMVELSHYTCPI